MKFQVDGWNNFCRVFELPDTFPKEFCFNGGHPVNFQLVDWFNPVPDMHTAACSKEVWKEKVGLIPIVEIDLEELEQSLIPFMKQKNYIKKGKIYLILYSFGGSSTFKVE